MLRERYAAVQTRIDGLTAKLNNKQITNALKARYKQYKQQLIQYMAFIQDNPRINLDGPAVAVIPPNERYYFEKTETEQYKLWGPSSQLRLSAPSRTLRG